MHTAHKKKKQDIQLEAKQKLIPVYVCVYFVVRGCRVYNMNTHMCTNFRAVATKTVAQVADEQSVQQQSQLNYFCGYA